MAADGENPVLEPLGAIRAALADPEREVAGNTLQIAALGQQGTGLTTAVDGGNPDLEDVRRRVERLARRLELREGFAATGTPAPRPTAGHHRRGAAQPVARADPR